MAARAALARRSAQVLGVVGLIVVALLCAPTPSSAATPGECTIHSLPSFTAQGERTFAAGVADVIEVACYQEAGQSITLEDPELYSRCSAKLNWASTSPYSKVSGTKITVSLDSFGNATVILWGAPCSPGETLLSASLGVSPFTAVNTTFSVLPAAALPAGVYALPGHQVSSAEHTAALIIETAFNNGAQHKVEIGTGLFHRCQTKPHLRWIHQGRETIGAKAVTLTLDNNGNAFTLLVAGPGCQVGQSLIVAELVESPFTAYTTSFAVEPPTEVL